jgi:hypothetical protein
MLVLIRSGLKKLVIAVIQVRFCKTLRFLNTAQIIIVLIESRISPLRGSRSRPGLFLFALFEILDIIIVFFSGYSYGIRFLRFSFEKLLFPSFIVIPSLTLRIGVRHHSGGVLSHFPEVFFKYLFKSLRFSAANRNIIDIDSLLTYIVQSSGGGP